MKIAMVGLGKMGANMSQRLIEHGHEVVAFDLNEAARAGAAAFGRPARRHPGGAGRRPRAAPGGLGHGAGRQADQRHHHHTGRAVRIR